MSAIVSAIDSSRDRPSFERAYALQQEGKFGRAAAAYARFLKSSPNEPSALNNLGNCLRSLGRDSDAVVCFEKALAIIPGKESARLNLGLARLALGEYRKAWPDYETRLEGISHRRELLAYRRQQWRGEPLGGDRTLYLFGNQGLGDELQCLRFIPMVAERVERIVLELQKPLLSLVVGLPSNVEVVGRGDSVPPFHHWCELFSLPGIFEIEPSSVPPPVRPDFRDDVVIGEVIAKSREHYPGQLHVGLAWSGNPGNDLNRFRACGLKHLAPLFDLPGIRFFSLQKGSPSTELGGLSKSAPVVDLAPHLSDFAATATAVDCLDLLISVDTSVAHLAGTLGANSWIVLHQPADWRWGREGESTPWYPSLRLFRQENMREWETVIRRVRSELATFSERK